MWVEELGGDLAGNGRAGDFDSSSSPKPNADSQDTGIAHEREDEAEDGSHGSMIASGTPCAATTAEFHVENAENGDIPLRIWMLALPSMVVMIIDRESIPKGFLKNVLQHERLE
ncbi:hypothetical protein AC579_3960 [Pseudocercospora musae]|uniref:Uncharacterized protein n=1 Tax=Pseudocercospora musae TaxID=113226 RepID=A0A139I1S5_9PEZI|nr:hypothetical protein AC579_3960 [Pseudocercospora musae]